MVIAGVGIVAALAVAQGAARRNADVARDRFEALVARLTDQIDDRLRLYEYGLKGARGAVIAAGVDGITRKTFRRYSESRDTDTEFLGSRGFGWIRRVPVDRLPNFLERARRDGRPDLSIRQLAAHEGERFVIEYVEPETPNKVAIGLDVASEALRREAATLAMDSGRATLTAPVTLVQATGQPSRGFLLFLPVTRPVAGLSTVDERRASTVGWTYMPLVIDEVLARLDLQDGEFGFSLSDRDVERSIPFYASSGGEIRGSNALRQRRTIDLYGRQWDLDVWSLPPFIQRLDLPSPHAAAALPLAGGLLGAGAAYGYLAGVRRRLQAGIEKARLAAIVESSNDAIVGMALDGTITDWNGGAERLFGYSAAEAVGRVAPQLITPKEIVADDERMIARISRGESVSQFRSVRIKRDGTVFNVLVSISAIRAADGKIVGAAKTLQDVSAQVAAERTLGQLNAGLEQQVAERTAELRASSALQTAILDYAGYAVIATDRDGTITLFNPAAESMLGYAAEEMVGRRTPATFHDGAEVVERAASLSAELGSRIEPGFEVFVAKAKLGLPSLDQWTYIAKDGKRFPVSLSISVLKGDDGQELGYLGIARDLSDQLRDERELKVAKTEAEAAARAKSEFLAAMSHELRTPLNSVIGFSRLMLDSGELRTPTMEHYGRLVHDASKTLLTVVNDILEVSRIEAGALELDPRVFAPRELFEGVVELIRPQLRSTEVRLSLAIVDELPTRILGDDARLRQVLLNLLSNALKFTARGRVDVVVEARPGHFRSCRLHVSVRDTGIGIPETKRHRIFERFSQADSSTSRTYGGTGLGLPISKSLVELMGGQIGFESTEGVGSSFWFEVELPIAAAPSPLERRETTVAADAPTPLSILLAEDVEMNQELAVAVLARWGHRVDVVANGAQAVDAVRKSNYDLVLMDVHMPVMDGIEATRRIRAMGGRHVDIPILAMTANVMADEVASFRAAGMDDHVGKPFEPEELLAAIRRGAQGRRSELHDVRSPETSSEGNRESVLDETILDTLSGIIGRDKTASLLQVFVREASRRVSIIEAERTHSTLASQAHSLISLAGQLGFSELCQLAVRLEEAALAGAGLDRVPELRKACDLAIAAATSSRYAMAQ